jgi:hypothetical protein
LQTASDTAVGSFTFTSPYRFDPAPYSTDAALKYTRCKTGECSYRYDLTKESLKKKIVLAFSEEPGVHGGVVVRVKPGAKFDPAAFARRAFVLPHEEEWVRTRIEVRLGS